MENDLLDNDLNPTVNSEYANFGERFLASLIDVLLIGLPIGFLNIYFLLNHMTILVLVILILNLLYKPVFESMFGATVGKMIMKLKVVDEDSEQIDLAQSFKKNIFYVLTGIMNIASTFMFLGTDGYLDSESYMELAQAQSEGTNMILTYATWAITLFIIVACFMMLGNSKKQTLYDQFAGTYLIKK